MSKMSIETFDKLIDDFYEFMCKPMKPNHKVKIKWLENVYFYSEKDLFAAFDHMKDTLDGVPRNFPKAIRTAASIIIAGKDKRNDWINYGACTECNASGFFSMRYFNDIHKRWYTAIAFCASCENWQNLTGSPGKRVTSYHLAKQGYKFKPGNECSSVPDRSEKGRGSVGKIEKLNKKIMKPMAKPKDKDWATMVRDLKNAKIGSSVRLL